jgi:hypothetical protein
MPLRPVLEFFQALGLSHSRHLNGTRNWKQRWRACPLPSRATVFTHLCRRPSPGSAANREDVSFQRIARTPPTLPIRGPWLSPLPSLIGADSSLFISKEIPVPPSREFGAQSTETKGKIRLENRPGRRILRKIPVKIPVILGLSDNPKIGAMDHAEIVGDSVAVPLPVFGHGLPEEFEHLSAEFPECLVVPVVGDVLVHHPP